MSSGIPAEFRGGVIVAGAGVSGLGMAKLFAGIGVGVLVADDSAAGRARAEAAGHRTASTAEALSLIHI